MLPDALLLATGKYDNGKAPRSRERATFQLWGRNLTDEDSIVMATRWLQIPYFSFATPNTVAPGASTGSPRAFFGTLRRGPSWGVEARITF